MLTVDLDLAEISPTSRVLDLGCGTGRHTFAAARRGAAVVAVDLDLAATREVATMLSAMDAEGELPDAKSLGVAGASAFALPFASGSFDVVVASEVLEHLPDDTAALVECARVLRAGGVLALSVPRAFPERVNWWLSDAYHDTEGGHVRVYRRSVLLARARRAGLVPERVHHAHALHSPFWWLRCLVGVDRDDQWAVRAYHRLLVYEIVRAPAALRRLEQLLAPVLGKSLVVYLRRPPR